MPVLLTLSFDTSLDLVNWFALTNAFTISNGQIQVDDTGRANLPRRLLPRD